MVLPDISPNEHDLPPIVIDPSLQFTRKPPADGYAYWASLRRDRAMPARRDIDPVAMRGFLPHVCLVEVHRGKGPLPDYRIRLAGTFLARHWGETTGKWINEFAPPYMQKRMHYTFGALLEARAALRITGAFALENRSWLTVESCLAPLSDDGQIISMIFVVWDAWS